MLVLPKHQSKSEEQALKYVPVAQYLMLNLQERWERTDRTLIDYPINEQRENRWGEDYIFNDYLLHILT